MEAVADNLKNCVLIDHDWAKFLETERPDREASRLRDASVMLANMDRRRGLESEALEYESRAKSMVDAKLPLLTLRYPEWRKRFKRFGHGAME